MRRHVEDRVEPSFSRHVHREAESRCEAGEIQRLLKDPREQKVTACSSDTRVLRHCNDRLLSL
jgi:hypothetical protein